MDIFERLELNLLSSNGNKKGGFCVLLAEVEVD